jgi:hypothetical protein
LKIDLDILNPKLKEIILKSLDDLGFYLQALKDNINEKMNDGLKNENKGLLKDDVNFQILNKKGKLSEVEKIEKKKLQRKITRQSNIEEIMVINIKV